MGAASMTAQVRLLTGDQRAATSKVVSPSDLPTAVTSLSESIADIQNRPTLSSIGGTEE